jgi:hypothetical protein
LNPQIGLGKKIPTEFIFILLFCRGQLTASAVPAIDFAWHKVKDPNTGFVLDVAAIDTNKTNITPNFYDILHNLTTDGRCWVSIVCFPPKELLENGIADLIESVQEHLQIFFNTVVKSVKTDDESNILSLVAIQREVQEGVPCGGYDIFLSKDIKDW